jgi:hypothetical protein
MWALFVDKLGVLHRVRWAIAALLRGHWRGGATVWIGNAIWRAVCAKRIVPIASRQKCTWRIATNHLLIGRVSHGQVCAAHILEVYTAWALVQSQLRTVNLNATTGLTSVTEFKFIRQCESIDATCVPPVNPTVCTKGRFELGIDWGCTSAISACLAWSATVAKLALLASAIAVHLRPETSRCQSVGEAVPDFLSWLNLPHRISRHIF